MKKKQARILIWDIESTPHIGYTWGKYKQNVIEFLEESYLLSFSAKWLYSSNIIVKALPDFPLYKKHPRDDKSLALALWELLDEADIIVTYNGNQFDIKKANAAFIRHKLPPPSPYKSIDMLVVYRRLVKEPSNKLDDVGKRYGLGEKKETGGFKLWKDCMDGDMRAWGKLKKYNKQDVLLLEKIYLDLRGWINNHPNVNIIGSREEGCPNCGSMRLHSRGVDSRTRLYDRYQCQSCYFWCRSRRAKSKERLNYV